MQVLLAAESEKCDALTVALARSRAENADITSAMEALKAAYATLSLEAQSMRDTLERLGPDTVASLQKASHQLEREKENTRRMVRRCRKLGTDLAAVCDLKLRERIMQHEVRSLKTLVLETMVASEEEGIKAVRSFAKEAMRTVEAREAALKETRAQLAETRDTLERERVINAAKIKALQDQVMDLKAEAEQMKKKLKDSSRLGTVLRATITELKSKLDFERAETERLRQVTRIRTL